jgi:SAM-dependent methyltransferase
MTIQRPANSEGANSPAKPLLGGVFAHAPQEFGVATGPRGRDAICATCDRLTSGEYAQEFIPCICGSLDEICIAAVDRYGIPHRTVLCTRCGLLRTNPRMTADAYAHFYQHLYRAIYERPGHDPDAYFAMQETTGRLRASRTLRRVKLRVGSSVAEIGCGAGWNLLPYSDIGCRVVGWDVDEGYLALGRARGLDLRDGLLSTACSSGERFDLVVLSHVLEHLLDPIADLNALKFLLNGNGLLSIEVPSAFATARMERYFQNAHTWSFVPETLRAVMQQAGFECIAMNGVIESIWRPCSTVASAIPANPMLVRRTASVLVARQRRRWLLDREMGLRHRFWRVRDAMVIWPRLSVGPI